MDVVEFGADGYAHRKQVGVKQLYNHVSQTAWGRQSVRGSLAVRVESVRVSSSSVPVVVGNRMSVE